MIGTPIENGTWNGVEAGYYAGMGSGEMIWLLISIVMCVIALVVGSRHEKSSYRKAEIEGVTERR